MAAPLKYLDLFSGIGGFRCPLEKRGHKSIGFSEIDKPATLTYKVNFDTSEEIEFGDITAIDEERIPDFDLLVGGFPCQAFSISGKRRGFNDTRGTLFFQIARILKSKQPKYFILENVKGLINHDKPRKSKGFASLVNSKFDGKKKGIGRTLQVIEEALVDCGYVFKWEVLNTVDYGLPQNRERIIIVGQRKDLGEFGYEFPEKEELKLCVRHLLEKKVDKKYFLSEKVQEKILTQLKEKYDFCIPAGKNQDSATDKKQDNIRFLPKNSEKPEFGKMKAVQCVGSDLTVGISIPDEQTIIDDRQSDLRLYHQISPTLRSDRQGLYVKNALRFVGGFGPVRKGCEGQESLSRAYKPKDRVFNPSGVAPTLMSGEQSGRYNFLVEGELDEEQGVFFLSREQDNLELNDGVYPITKKGKELRMRSIVTCLDANYFKGLDKHEARTGVMIIDNQGRLNKKIVPTSIVPTLRAETHGNLPMVIDPYNITIPKNQKVTTALRTNHSNGNAWIKTFGYIRRLTPLECFRLQGFSDEHWRRAKEAGVSDTQLYKQAGNAVSTPVIEKVVIQLEKWIEKFHKTLF